MRSQSAQCSISPHVSCDERKTIYRNNSGRSHRSSRNSEESRANASSNRNTNGVMAFPDSASLATSATECSTFFPEATFGETTRRKGSSKDSREMLENVERVLRFAQKRLRKSRVENFYEKKKKKYGNSADGGMLHVQHSDVELDSVLGNGSYNAVYSVKRIKGSLLDRQEIVVKTLRSKLLSDLPMLAACAADLRKEGLILATLQQPPSVLHPGANNIIKCLGWAPTGLSAYANGCHDSFFLILEKLDRTLADTLKEWRLLENSNEDEKHRESLRKSFRHGPKTSSRSVLLSNVKNSFFRNNSKTPLDTSERDQSTASTYSNFSEPEQVQFWKLRLSLLVDLCGAIAYLHSQRIIHRDLKPDNVGFDTTGTLKVFDFDVSRVLPHQANWGDYRNETFKMTRNVGSPRYMSPEVARGENYNEKADVYALGLLAYEILTLKRPFDSFSSKERGRKGGKVDKDCVQVVVRDDETDGSDGKKQKRRNSFGNFPFRKSSGSGSADQSAGSSGKLGSMFRRRRSHSRGSSKKSNRRSAKYANIRPLLPVATPHELSMEQNRHESMRSEISCSQKSYKSTSSNSTRSHLHSVNNIDIETTSFFWTRSLRTIIDQAWSYDIPTRPFASQLKSLIGEELERIELHEDLSDSHHI